MKRFAKTILLAAAAAAVCLFAHSGRAEKTVTLTFTGDCTLGSQEFRRGQPDSLDAFAAREGYDYFFANFRDMFSADDCTVVNLEGVLSNTASGESSSKTYCFRGPTDFVNILTGSSIEVAGIANNHIMDYSTIGFRKTMATLDDAGVAWIRALDCYVLEKDGIRVAVFATDYSIVNTQGERVLRKMREMKANGEANAIAVIFHNGNEYDAKHTDLQERKAAEYIENGADLVIMHHPHVVQGITVKNNRSVFYSLGNFVFGGNKDIKEKQYRNTARITTSLYTLVVQARLRFRDDGTYLGQQMIVYPGYTSGDAPRNNYQPRRVTVEETEPIMDAIRFDSSMDIPDPIPDENGLARIIMPFLSAAKPGSGVPGAGVPENPPERPERGTR